MHKDRERKPYTPKKDYPQPEVTFDVSQLTEGRRPPEFFTAIQGDHQALHARLIQAVQKEGITYRESVDTEGARGYSAGGLIVVRPDQPPGNKSRYTRLRRETRETSKPPGEAD